jgi:RNA polymerase sigma-54 factor
MKQTIQLRLGQQLTMTPQLQQAIKLLQLSTLDLQKEIQDALDSNYMLEREEGADGDNAGGADADQSVPPGTRAPIETDAEPVRDTKELAIDREVRAESNEMPDELPVDTRWDDVYDSYLPSGSGAADDGDNDIFAHQSRPESLQDYLYWQLNLSRLAPRDEIIARAVIDAIDPDGYLRTDLDDLVATAAGALNDPGIAVSDVQTVMHRVQSFDPPGVGARDLRECLLIQLRQLPPGTRHRELAIAVCADGFDHLPRKDVPALTRLLDRTEAEIVDAIDLIRRQNPRPGSLIASAPSEYVVPDVFVRRKEGAWQVELNPEAAPKLRVNADYASLIRRADQSADGVALKSHLQEARWFIKSLASRNETVLRVAAKLVELQQEFFEHGEEAMRPLILRDVADALELHESTVSRVTTQKYMHTPRGTFEFKYFFSSHVSTAEGGECSSTAIRALIRKLISAESTKRPLSDNKIAAELAEQGINVARRTVAKYREAMGIPPSNERKRLA